MKNYTNLGNNNQQFMQYIPEWNQLRLSVYQNGQGAYLHDPISYDLNEFFAPVVNTLIHVPGDYPTIQEGINAADDGDTVLVDQDIYYENINFIGKAILVTSNYLLEKDSAHIFNTIINGSQPIDPDVGSVVRFVNGEDTSSCIYGFTLTGGTGTMIPFTFPVCAGGGINISNSNCKIESNIIIGNECIIDETDALATGGGISCGLAPANSYLIISNNLICNNTVWSQGSSTSWDLGVGEGGGIAISLASNCIIKHNQIHSNICKSANGYSLGGAIRLTTNLIQSVIVIDSNEIYNNESLSPNDNAFAGGISCSKTNAIIRNNKIRDNYTEGYQSRGCGIFFDLADTFSADVFNNIVIGNNCVANSSDCYGGALGIYRSYELNIFNNLILGNSAKYGGAFYLRNSYPTFINNTISENFAEISGGGMYFYNSSSGAVVINSILWNNSANGLPNEIYTPNPDMLEIAYSNIKNGWEGINNIDEDPLFIDDSCHLHNCSSPCINTGVDSLEINGTWYYCPSNDIDYEQRSFENTLPDIGSDETPCFNTVIKEDQKSIDRLLLNYPNPFYNQTIIYFNCLKIEYVELSIYNNLCKKVQILVSKELSPGNHQFEWDTEGFPAGIYFCVLMTKEGIQTEKIIKL